MELKPCPFCGGKASQKHDFIGYDWFYISCEKCGTGTKAYRTVGNAYKSWNKRIN